MLPTFASPKKTLAVLTKRLLNPVTSLYDSKSSSAIIELRQMTSTVVVAKHNGLNNIVDWQRELSDDSREGNSRASSLAVPQAICLPFSGFQGMKSEISQTVQVSHALAHSIVTHTPI
jgi:hypothetical protein